ncbi:MAG TPA: hypothetical protein DDW20_02665 [Firmicutes bacterium]|nr:hypothetical protein [Bacillota bacterium]
MLKNLHMKVTAYCYDDEHRVIKKIDKRFFTKIEDIGSCIMVTHSRHDVTLIDKEKLINFVFFA